MEQLKVYYTYSKQNYNHNDFTALKKVVKLQSTICNLGSILSAIPICFNSSKTDLNI